MINFKHLDQLERLLHQHDFAMLRKVLIAYHASDIADFLVTISPEDAAIIFRLLPKELGAETFSFLDSDVQEQLVRAFQDEELTHLFSLLQTDDAVDFLEELPANAVNRILELTPTHKRRLINQFLQFPPDTAGSIMTSEFIQLKRSMSVAEALQYIRRHGSPVDTIYTAYVTGEARLLEGVIGVKHLLLSDDDETVANIMDQHVISVTTHQDQEEVLGVFREYDFFALPVVDEETRLVGIITLDDILDIADEEATEDFERMAAMAPSDRPYLKTSIIQQSRNRFTWLMILMFSGMLNGMILQHYEEAFLMLPILVTFIPMLMDTGGNAGSQSSTLIIRGMALNEIGFHDFFRVMRKELGIASLVGLGLAIMNFLRIYLQYDHQWLIALTVSLALFGIVVFAKFFGFSLPLLAKKVGLDPALMAAPLITTFVDTLGLVLYFEVANRLLSLR